MWLAQLDLRASNLSVLGEAIASEQAVLRQAFREHAQALRRVLVRLAGAGADPDDLVQEVFLTTWQRRGALREGAVTRQWLYGVALKVAARARRRNKLRQFLGLEAIAHLAAEEEASSELDRREATRQLNALLECLSEKKRTAFILHELEGLSGEEIAQLVDCPVQTVWTRLYHARQELEQELARRQRALRNP